MSAAEAAIMTAKDVPDSVNTPGPEFVSRATALRGLLERNRVAGDERRRLTDPVMAELAGTGLSRMWVPRRFGGWECDLRTMVDTTIEVTKGDPSAGWVHWILGCGDWLVGLFPEAGQAEVYANGPDTRVCSVFAPSATAHRVAGGWTVSGRWSPASGCAHAQWAMLGFPRPDAAEKGHHPDDGDLGFALIPMSELRVEDTWFTTGMRGTGSNTLSGEHLFVPDHRVLPVMPAVRGDLALQEGGAGSPRYRTAFLPTLVTHMMGPYIGMARAALELVSKDASTRGISFTTYGRRSDSTAFQLAVAEATARVDAATALAHSAAESIDAYAAAGTYPDVVSRARVRMHFGHVVAQCCEAVDLLVSAHGASAFAEANPLGGIVRDIQTASRHAFASPVVNKEVFGRAVLGVEENITEFI
ncbi:acyl-CoA dehydrogenase family protein [Streptomyces sp. NPDC007983]|uniref:acyl-CoA dehydrogenase family protein n=1 Tax=Streptomyces sp. NPDC007983 TaxID=3364800 RepID=UPI0036E23294